MQKYNKFAEEVYAYLKKYNSNVDDFDQLILEYMDGVPYIAGIKYSDEVNEFGVRPVFEFDYGNDEEENMQLHNKFGSILNDVGQDKNIPNSFYYNDWGMFYIELKPSVKAMFFPEDSPVWGNK